LYEVNISRATIHGGFGFEGRATLHNMASALGAVKKDKINKKKILRVRFYSGKKEAHRTHSLRPVAFGRTAWSHWVQALPRRRALRVAVRPAPLRPQWRRRSRPLYDISFKKNHNVWRIFRKAMEL